MTTGIPKIGRRAVLGGMAAAGVAGALPRLAGAQETPRKGGKLRMAMPYLPAALDPMTGRNSPDFNTLYAIFDALIDFDPNTMELKPGLAKAWKFDTPTTLSMDLATGVSFHDGTPFDAEAVKFNIERHKNDKRSLTKADAAPIESVEVVNPARVVLHLNRPAASLPAILTDRIGTIVSPKSIKDAGPDGNVDRNPVGTGAWKFVSWDSGGTITMTRNDKFWAKPAWLDSMVFTVISELATALRSVIADENDLAIDLAVSQKPVADAASGIRSLVFPTSIYWGGFINFGKPPFNDVRVRQALNYAVDREEYNKVINLGLGETSSTVVPRAHWACDPTTAGMYTYDPEKAKKLLADAGFPNGIDIETIGWPDQISMRQAELITAQVAKAGIRIKLTPVSPQESNRVFMVEKKGSLELSPTGGRPDPGQFNGQMFAKEGFFNAASAELPGFHELLAATDAATDLDSRKKAFASLQKFTVEQAMTLVMAYIPAFSVYNPRVHNYKGGLLNRPKFHDVWMST